MNTYLHKLPNDIIQHFHNIYSTNLSLEYKEDKYNIVWKILIHTNDVEICMTNYFPMYDIYCDYHMNMYEHFKRFKDGKDDKLYYSYYNYCDEDSIYFIERQPDVLIFNDSFTSVSIKRTRHIDTQLYNIIDTLIQITKDIMLIQSEHLEKDMKVLEYDITKRIAKACFCSSYDENGCEHCGIDTDLKRDKHALCIDCTKLTLPTCMLCGRFKKLDK